MNGELSSSLVHGSHRVEHEGHEDLGELLRVSGGGRIGRVQITDQRETFEPLMVLQQKQGFLDQGVQDNLCLGLPLGPAEIEQTINDPSTAVHLLINDLQILVDNGLVGFFEATDPATDRRHARANGSQRVIDLVHDTSRELSDGGQLLTLHDLPRILRDSVTSSPMVITWLIRSPSRRMGILLSRNGSDLATHGDFELILQDLSALEYLVELGFELGRRLAREHLEHLAAHDLITPEW